MIGFGAGEPDFPTPDTSKVGIQAIQNNDTKYAPSAGTVELRKGRMSAAGRGDCGVDYEPSQISVSSGASPVSIRPCGRWWIRRRGDPARSLTGWSYIELIRMVGGVPVVVEASEAEHFKITPESWLPPSPQNQVHDPEQSLQPHRHDVLPQ